jgi:hypothetical protein
VRQQRLHLPSQRFVVSACRRHERGSLAHIADERGVADVSSTLKPPKKRNSITRLFRTSTAANASKARSRASTSTAGSGDVTSPSSSVTRWASPPRL